MIISTNYVQVLATNTWQTTKFSFLLNGAIENNKKFVTEQNSSFMETMDGSEGSYVWSRMANQLDTLALVGKVLVVGLVGGLHLRPLEAYLVWMHQGDTEQCLASLDEIMGKL